MYQQKNGDVRKRNCQVPALNVWVVQRKVESFGTSLHAKGDHNDSRHHQPEHPTCSEPYIRNALHPLLIFHPAETQIRRHSQLHRPKSSVDSQTLPNQVTRYLPDFQIYTQRRKNQRSCMPFCSRGTAVQIVQTCSMFVMYQQMILCLSLPFFTPYDRECVWDL